MKLKFFILIGLIVGISMPTIANASAFEMDDYAIVDSADADITTEEVELNSDADVANVASFDIAGVMLGMSFDDVQTLFFKNKGLYSPRKQNSIIYTMHNDWKYNLDYECRNQGIVIPSELEKCINFAKIYFLGEPYDTPLSNRKRPSIFKRYV